MTGWAWLSMEWADEETNTVEDAAAVERWRADEWDDGAPTLADLGSDGAPMTAYEPGTVATATVRGVEDVRVVRVKNEEGWLTPQQDVMGLRWHPDEQVTDVRPAFALDQADDERTYLATILRSSASDLAHALADEIDPPTPKPDEPTLPHAAVRDVDGQVWNRGRDGRWYRAGGGWLGGSWDEVQAVEVLFPGAEDES